jgi:hypothetical protein
MFDQLLAEIVPSLTKGRPNNNNTNTNTNNNNNKAKCIPGGTLRVLAGKNLCLRNVAIEFCPLHRRLTFSEKNHR